MAKITKTASGKYHTSVFIGYDLDGKRKYKSITAPSKKEVARLAAIAVSSGAVPNIGNMTVGEAYEKYIDSKSNVLSPSTVGEYRRAAQRDFPQLLNIQLKRLTAPLIQAAVNEIAAKNSPKTVRNKYYLLESVLKDYAPDLQLRIRLPQKKESEMYLPTEQEVFELIQNANSLIRVPILLAALGGLRRSEVCALTPDDFGEDYVRIKKAKVNGEYGFVTKQPKSKSGSRKIPLAPEIVAECRSWEYFGLSPNTLNNNFRRLRNQLGIPVHFHTLRHFYCSMMINQGMSFRNAMEYGGWNSVHMVERIYGHAMKTKSTDAKVISIFSKFTQKKPSVVS